MHATIRRYEGVDMARTNEVTGKVNETLVPQLRKLPGFAGYYLIEGGNAVLKFSSVIHFATTLVDSSACSGVSNKPSELSTPLPPSIR